MKKALSVAMLAIWFVLMSWLGGRVFDQFADDPNAGDFMLVFSAFFGVAGMSGIPVFYRLMREFGV